MPAAEVAAFGPSILWQARWSAIRAAWLRHRIALPSVGDTWAWVSSPLLGRKVARVAWRAAFRGLTSLGGGLTGGKSSAPLLVSSDALAAGGRIVETPLSDADAHDDSWQAGDIEGS